MGSAPGAACLMWDVDAGGSLSSRIRASPSLGTELLTYPSGQVERDGPGAKGSLSPATSAALGHTRAAKLLCRGVEVRDLVLVSPPLCPGSEGG